MTTAIVQSISDEQLAELEDLCGKATQGKWWIDSHGVTMMAMDSLEVVFTTPCDPKMAIRHPETGNLSNWRNDWDASYIATACPSKIQSLIARLRAAEDDAKRYRWLRDKTSMPCVVCTNPQVDKYFNEYMMCGDVMDKAIDAAMERDK